MQKHTFTSKSLEDALGSACKYFSVDLNAISYNIIPKQGKGLLSKLFNRSISIEAWVEADFLQEAARAAVKEALSPASESRLQPAHSKRQTREPHAPNKQRSGAASSEGQKVFVNFDSPGLVSLFDTYASRFFEAFEVVSWTKTYKSQEGLVIEASDENLEKILSQSDKFSAAFEHLFKRIAQKQFGDLSERIRIEAGSAQQAREKKLNALAAELAERVKSTGKSVVLSSHTSQERRIIHLALEGVEGIGTKSIGSGDKRKLVVFSKSASAAAAGTSSGGHPLPQGNKGSHQHQSKRSHSKPYHNRQRSYEQKQNKEAPSCQTQNSSEITT